MIKRSVCFLCQVELEPIEPNGKATQQHPLVEDCQTIYTDDWGVPVEVTPVEHQESLIDVESSSIDEEGIVLQRFPLVDDVLGELFDGYGLERLGGQSSGRGWSSFALYQRCPYAWKRRYIEKAQSALWTEPPALAIGSLVHAFLALHYSAMMEGNQYAQITPLDAMTYCRARANPEFVNEAWRVFSAYELYYRHEEIIPLAIEHDLRDPRTGESCRYDMIAYVPEDRPMMLSGTYIFEHKTAGRFDWDTLNGWQNDGECLGEVALWKRLGLDNRFGPLRGLCVNILGKQPKEPKQHRTVVAPSTWQIDQHLRDLTRWEGLIQLAKSMDVFPRARAGCVGRFGACSEWDHCLNNENF